MALADEIALDTELGLRGPFSVGDYLAYLFAGKGPWRLEEGIPFKFPVSWMLLFSLLLYMTLRYPVKDLRGIGALVVVAGQSRWAWWLSKCAWVAVLTGSMLILILVIAVVWAVLTGGDIMWVPSASIEAVVSQEPDLRPEDMGSMAPFFLGVLVLSVALAEVQLVLSLFVRPLLSFTACFSILFVSACQFSPLLLGNYLIAMRSSALMLDGFDPLAGIATGVAICVLAVILGGIRFSLIDLFDKEFDT